MQEINLNQVKILPLDVKNVDDVISIQNNLNIHILSKENILNDINNSNFKCIVAVYDKEIIGYISFSYIFDIEIESVLVKSSYQRQGIGTLLLNYIFKFAKENKINNVFLEVRKSNIGAISLYRKLGFSNISIRKKYYENAEDALILKKEIK
jgi:ribosomal-protein-alanine N-acetyltransferase